MNNYLEKILSLAKKTGDRIIVLDKKNPRHSYVLVDIEEYEHIIEDKKDEFNDDVSDISQNYSFSDDLSDFDDDYADDDEYKFENYMDNEKMPEHAPKDYGRSQENVDVSPKLDNYEDYGRINNDFGGFQESGSGTKKRWEIPKEVKQTGQERSGGLGEKPFNQQESEEEHRYYLETI